MSNDLVHWIRGDDEAEAFGILNKIVADQCLNGGTGCIKDEYRCICFTEAFSNTFRNIRTRYQPFGIRVPKHWAFKHGGRPVIYQPVEEFDPLPESHRWRHVTFNPSQDRNAWIDCTWEREWRIHRDELPLTDEASVIVPTGEWARQLQYEHMQRQQALEATVHGTWDPGFQEPFPYEIVLLDE